MTVKKSLSALLMLIGSSIVAAPAAAQSVVTTTVGDKEVIAVTVDGTSGSIYFATDRPGAIYRLPPGGAPVLVAGVAGGRTDDGAPAAQSAVFPGRNGLAVDAAGLVYFSEPSLHRIRQIDGSGTVTTIAGSGLANQVDPSNIFGNFSRFTDLPAPTALAFNPVTGDLFATDETWDIVVRITANGAAMSSSTTRTFPAVGGDPNSPDIFADFRWYNAFGYKGDGGPAIDAKMNHPRGLAFDGNGNLYIADTGNHVIRRVDGSGTITTAVGVGTPGSSGDGGAATNAQLFLPTGLLVTQQGSLVIADTGNHRVRAVDPGSGTIATIAGSGTAGHAGDLSTATAATLAYPTGVAQAQGDALLIVDSQNNRVRSVSQSVITTLAQTGSDYSGNGAPGGNGVNHPLGVAFDGAGNMFFTDTGNARVRRVDATTHAVTTVVGSGIPGYGGDNGPAAAAMLNCPTALTFDKNGVLFVADGCANVVRRVVPGADGIVKGDADEIITTYAGTGVRYGAGDGKGGPATSARLANPVGLAIDSGGILYIGELDAFDIRSVDATGIIAFAQTEIVPTGLIIDPKYGTLIFANQEEDDLECGGNQIFQPRDVDLPVGASGAVLDAAGRLYLSDSLSLQSVYRLANSGGGAICDATQATISVAFIAGNGTGTIGYSGDGGAPSNATFNSPAGIGIDVDGSLVIADAGNDVIRRVQQPSVGVKIDVTSLDFGIQGLQAATSPAAVNVTSTGTAAVAFSAISLIGANPGDFSIAADGCSGAVLSVDASCQIKVIFKPTAIGVRTATLQINDNASGSPQLVALSGVGASLTVSPLSIAFPSQTVAIASAPVHARVTNGTATTTTVLSLQFSGANAGDFAVASDACSGVALAAQATCTFDVVFSPQDLGARSATLNVVSNAADSPQTIGLSGTGIAAFPAAQLAPASIVFPTTSAGKASSDVTVTVSSTGTAPLSLTSLTLTGNQPGEFTITGGTCMAGASLTPGQSCSALVAFAPQTVCNSKAALSIADNATGSPQTVALSGISASGPGGPFTTALFCTSHAAQPRELAASPDGRVWFNEFGSAFAAPALATVSTTDGVKEDSGAYDAPDVPSGLAFTPDGSHAYFESQINVGNWISIVNPSGVKLKSPTTFPFAVIAGPDNGFLEVHDFSCGDFPLLTDFAPNGKTTELTPTAAWIFANASQHFCVSTSSVAIGPDGATWVGITNDGGGVNALHAASPKGFIRVAADGTFVDFTPSDNPPVGTTLGADGNLYALVPGSGSSCGVEQFDAKGGHTAIPIDSNVAIPTCLSIATGPDRRIWMVGTTGFAGGFARAVIALDPVSGVVSAYPTPAALYLTPGPDEGIWFDAVPSAVGRLDIGGGPASGFVMPQTLSFLANPIGVSSAVQAVTLHSTGTAPLVISSVSLGGADPAEFVFQDGCSGRSLPPGSTCMVQVASQSTKAGSHAATLLINDNDVFSPHWVRLAEFTIPPAPSVTPASLSFPATNVGQQSLPATLTLNNPTDRPLLVQYVSPVADTADFKIVADNCSQISVPAGGACTVKVAFTPTASGTRTASLAFNDTLTQTVTLTGGGQASSGGGGNQNGGSCACSATGFFVDPKVVAPSNAATSPSGGSFTLSIGGSTVAPTSLTVTKKSGGPPVLSFTPPPNATWPIDVSSPYGFSPDGNRFVVHYQANGEDSIELYDLTGTPNTRFWAGTIPILGGGSTTGTLGFSPLGQYLVTAQDQLTPPPIDETVFLNIISATSASTTPLVGKSWSPIHNPAEPDTTVGSAFWGFGPDDQSFTYIALDATGKGTLTLLSLPSGTPVQSITFTSSVAAYVQYSPCGDVLGVVDQTTLAVPNPVSVTLYSTRAADARAANVGQATDLPTGATVTMTAGPTSFTANASGWPKTVIVGVNTAAAGCAAATTTGTGGGSGPQNLTSPTFTSGNPPNIAFEGQLYKFTFTASGTPKPTFELQGIPPSWQSIDPGTGEMNATPPVGTTSFDYTVIALSANIPAFAGPFHVNVTPPSVPGGGGSGPYEAEDEPAMSAAAMDQAQAPPSGSSTSGSLAAPSTLLLPNGRGQIALPADVTPSLSTFTYTETDAPTGPLGNLIFAALDFSLAAVDAVSGSAVSALADPPVATIVFRDADLSAARIRDVSTLGVYWWSGTAWINQLPCAGCGVNPAAHTVTVSLTNLGEYMLAASAPPPTVLTITATTMHVTVNTPFAGAVATFLPAAAQDSVAQYPAFIAWGDGQTSPAALSVTSTGSFVVSGTHAWTSTGTYPVDVTVLVNGAAQTAHTTAVVTAAQTPPLFTTAAPPLTATTGAAYVYTFAASGVPAPTFALASGAPSWLSIGAATGVVTGTPPSGTSGFTYSVVASNGVSPSATAGPFVVTVTSTAPTTADLAVTLGAPGTAAKNATITYSVVVKNNGPATASNSVVTLTAGPGAAVVGATPQFSLGGVDLWVWPVQTLAPGQSMTFTVRVKLTKAGIVLALATVGSETRDSKLSNNLTVALTTVK